MSRHRADVTLKQIRDFAARGADYAGSHSREEFEQDFLLVLGLVKLIEYIGEAAGRLNPETRERI